MQQFFPRSVACLTITALLLFGAAGCSSNKDKSATAGLHGVDDEKATDMNAANAKFEASKDPPLSAETHFAAGLLADQQGQYDRAIMQYNAALKIQPDYSGALFRLGIDYAQLKQYPLAIDAWKRYIKATNDSATGYNNLAFAQQLAGDNGGAEASYRKGIERDPKNEPCRVNYGLMLAKQGRISEAMLQLQAVLSPADVHYNIGSVYEQQGKTEQARVEYQEAIKLNPKHNDAQLRLASMK
jgi:superkiller protein 3